MSKDDPTRRTEEMPNKPFFGSTILGLPFFLLQVLEPVPCLRSEGESGTLPRVFFLLSRYPETLY